MLVVLVCLASGAVLQDGWGSQSAFWVPVGKAASDRILCGAIACCVHVLFCIPLHYLACVDIRDSNLDVIASQHVGSIFITTRVNALANAGGNPSAYI